MARALQPSHTGKRRRLAYLIAKYGEAIEYDLRAECSGASLGALWRNREWRELLNLIDRLPVHSQYHAAIANDEEYARLVVAAEIEKEEREGPQAERIWRPALTRWTPAREGAAEVVDALRSLQYLLTIINSKEGSSVKPPEPAPRPETAFESVRRELQAEADQRYYDEIVGKLLPNKRTGPAVER